MAVDILSRQQLSASFRGVPFRVFSETQQASGKRHIVHEYPSSDRRYIEDLGEIPRIFSISAFVHGRNYLRDAAELEEALRQDGPGILSMPNFGSQLVFAMPYTRSADQKSVGQINFDLSFQVGTDVTSPTESSATAETVFDAGDEARATIKNDFFDIYNIPIDRVSVETAINDVLTIKDTIYNASKEIATDLENISSIKKRIEDGVNSLVKDPESLADIFFGSDGLLQNVSVEVEPIKLGIAAAKKITRGTLI